MAKLPWNWRQRIEIVKEDQCDDAISFTLQWMDGKRPPRTPKDGEIGYIVLDSTGFVDDVEVRAQFRRRGLGSMLYRHALRHIGHLSTNWHSHSADARRVWYSLMGEYYYKTDLFRNRLTVRNRRRPLSTRSAGAECRRVHSSAGAELVGISE